MSNVDLNEIEVFEGMSFADLLKKIHNNSDSKSKTIFKLINDISSKIKDPNSAMLLVPLIANYLDVSVKNDEQLIKLAAIVQRVVKNSNNNDNENDSLLTAEEKKELLESIQSSGKTPMKRVK